MRRGRSPALRLLGVISAASADVAPLPPGVRLVIFRELAAAVREQPASRRAPPPPDVEAHCAAVGAIFAHSTIVPAPPGVVFRSRDALLEWLEVHHAALTDGLAEVDGHAEARVHVRRRVPAVAHEDSTDQLSASEELPALDERAREIFAHLGADIPSWVTTRVPFPRPRAVRVAGALDGDERRRVAGAPVGSSDGGDVLEASASFLVDRAHWRAFADRVAAEVRRDPALAVQLTGPWPPYDFVRMEFGG